MKTREQILARIKSLQDDPYKTRLSTLAGALSYWDAYDFMTELGDPKSYSYLQTDGDVWTLAANQIDFAISYAKPGYVGACCRYQFEELMWLVHRHDLANRLVTSNSYGGLEFLLIKEICDAKRRDGEACSKNPAATLGGFVRS